MTPTIERWSLNEINLLSVSSIRGGSAVDASPALNDKSSASHIELF
jgi:hypothetical protein